MRNDYNDNLNSYYTRKAKNQHIHQMESSQIERLVTSVAATAVIMFSMFSASIAETPVSNCHQNNNRGCGIRDV